MGEEPSLSNGDTTCLFLQDPDGENEEGLADRPGSPAGSAISAAYAAGDQRQQASQEQARQQPGPGQERPGPWPVFESRVVHASEAVGHDDEAGAGRYAHELPPGEVQQTVARLPGVQLLFRSSPPGSEGLVVEHVIAGLTLELQLVQLGAAESSGGGSESSEAPSERSGGLANGLASGTANGSTSRLTARAKLSHEGSGVVVAYRDDAAGSGARVLESPVRGCAAWDSGIGWMVLFDARSQLEHFTEALEQVPQLTSVG